MNSTKQRLFVEAYLGPARGNASEAARRAGYADPGNEGYRLKRRPDVQKEIERVLSERTFAASEVLELLTQHANASLEPFLRISGRIVTVDLSGEEAQQKLHLIKTVKTRTRSGGTGEKRWAEHETEISLHDPQAALVHLGRYWKLFTDRAEVTGANGAPIQVKHEYEQLRKLEPDELIRLHRQALSDS